MIVKLHNESDEDVLEKHSLMVLLRQTNQFSFKKRCSLSSRGAWARFNSMNDKEFNDDDLFHRMRAMLERDEESSIHNNHGKQWSFAVPCC